MRRPTRHVAIPCITFFFHAQSAMTSLTGCWAIIQQGSEHIKRDGKFHCQNHVRGMCLPCYVHVTSKYILSYSDLSSFLEVSLIFLSIFTNLMAKGNT